jgi:hypothetical protein
LKSRQAVSRNVSRTCAAQMNNWKTVEPADGCMLV